ncbi:MarR family transcriptional regulator [Mesonia sp. MT50]|uniref:MarR family transcriptional regulator n=1 Tax=Mesonia profundi TaxID=3070998 RepID=A0ABU1A2N9_9FLAO|nr:MarR family transcriptional regulator [Mesonia profundi]MDQ7917975.1 MarR family transcriptional regulator [Mesonia profundi]
MPNPKERNQLLEDIGLLIEERLGISPLAARIYSLLTISSYDGLSFEEIRKIIKASKSSTSVNVNVLLQLGYISYHTKPGDRKRYFKVAKYYQLESLELYHQSLKREIEMVDKINAYNKKYHPIKFTPEKSVGNIAQIYLKKTQDLVKTTMESLKKHRNTEK